MTGDHACRASYKPPAEYLSGAIKACQAWCHELSPPSSVITIISPGRTSRTRWKPMGPKAQSSLATHHSLPWADLRSPSTSGLRAAASEPTPSAGDIELEPARPRSLLHGLSHGWTCCTSDRCLLQTCAWLQDHPAQDLPRPAQHAAWQPSQSSKLLTDPAAGNGPPHDGADRYIKACRHFQRTPCCAGLHHAQLPI